MLDCMATCRCMDKKPYGNTSEEPTISKLVDKATFNNIRGNGIVESIIKSVRPVCTEIEGIDVGSAVISDSGSTIASLLKKNVPANLNRPASCAFLVEPAGVGELTAPLPGNWHRITGLIQ
ncbi:MAG: hypothetical protein NC389_09720 [Acetatifactor muris]|nr:hypothetical protein [Acetatifactor muris]